MQSEKISYNIVHTRSETSILRIPSLRGENIKDRKSSFVDIYPHKEELLMEHLTSLKNEGAVRRLIEEWSDLKRVKLLVIVVDMSEPTSSDKINFVRCSVDQTSLGSQDQKKLIMLLHYPPTMFLTRSFYPALFLGRWQHHFIDSLGVDRSYLSGVREMLLTACKKNKSDDDFKEAIKKGNTLLENCLKSIASWNVFYEGQLILGGTFPKSHYARHKTLERILLIQLGDMTIGDIISSKFASLWTKSRMTKVLQYATKTLEEGNSQLPITVCLQSILQDAMYQFATSFLCQVNKWKNLDILANSNKNVKSQVMFRQILLQLPSPPFEELIVSRATKPDMPALPHHFSQCRTGTIFPFFFHISTYIDTVVENVFSEKKETTKLSNANYDMYRNDIMSKLTNCDSNPSSDYSARNMVAACITTLTEDKNLDLYYCYLDQYVVWILGCETSSVTGSWFKALVDELTKSDEIGTKLVSIHLIHRIHEMKIFHLHSCKDFPSSFHEILKPCLMNSKDSSTLNYGLLTGSIILDKFLNWFENNIDKLDRSLHSSSQEWTLSFSLFMKRLPEFLCGSVIVDNTVANRLRKLLFINTLKQHEQDDILSEILEAQWRQGIGHSGNNISLSALFVTLGKISNEQKKLECKLSILQDFFSPTWLCSVTCKWEEDLKFLGEFICDSEEGTHQICQTLVQNSCLASIPLEHELPEATLKMTLSRLLCISSTMQCNGIANYSSEGLRLIIPRYVPYWWQDQLTGTSALQNDELLSFFDRHTNSFVNNCHADIMFDIIFKRLAEIMADSNSEKIAILLWKKLQIEKGLTRNEQSRLSRIRTYNNAAEDNDISLAGSPLSILIIEAYLLLYVLKVAFEFATESTCNAFNGVYYDKALSIFNRTMSSLGVQWQIFFLLNIIRIKGEGFLINLMNNNDIGDMKWAHDWKEGEFCCCC